MFGYYTPVLILQAFCVYHAYRSNAEQKWYWFILLFPVFGCIIYLFHNFSGPSSINTLKEGVKEAVNSNYKLEQLERALKLSDNVSNKMNLADAYVRYSRYTDAIALYQDCLSGFMADDPVLQMKLLQTYFLHQDYSSAVTVGAKLEAEKIFQQAEERLAYAWALHYTGKTEVAEHVFASMDRSFTNYKHRAEYCKFLMETGNDEILQDKLTELMNEFDLMNRGERVLYKGIIREVKDLHGNQLHKFR